MTDTTPAYDPHGLYVMSYADGFTTWHYRTRDPLAAVTAPGYLDGAHAMLRDGDRLAVNVKDAEGLTVEAQDFIVARRNGRVAIAPVGPVVEPGAVLRERIKAAIAA